MSEQPRVPAGSPDGGEWAPSESFRATLNAEIEKRISVHQEQQRIHNETVADLKQKIAESNARSNAMLRQMRKDERS